MVCIENENELEKRIKVIIALLGKMSKNVSQYNTVYSLTSEQTDTLHEKYHIEKGSFLCTLMVKKSFKPVCCPREWIRMSLIFHFGNVELWNNEK